MSSSSAAEPTTGALVGAQPPHLAAGREERATPGRRVRVLPQHLALAAVLGLSAILNVHRLARNEWANTFYSAAVRSMLRSWHNFFFVSFDPGGLITVDKPPLGLWVQATSAYLFGLHPLSLLLPEAIAGVLAVAALYWAVAPRFGAGAGVAAALALAVFPSFVAVSRDNNLDALLILLMVLACGVGLRAIDSGRLLTLLGCAALVGLAFNTKTLAAYLVVPGLALGYLVCAPGPLARRLAHLLAAGAVLLLVSVSWSAIVELTPASQRPFVGGSTDNTERDLTFGYNGFGRVEGQVGGPGRIPVVFRHGSLGHIEREALRAQASHGTERLTITAGTVHLTGANGAARAGGATGNTTGRTGAGGRAGASSGAGGTAGAFSSAGGTAGAPSGAGGTRTPGGTVAIHHTHKLSRFLPGGRERFPVAFGGHTGPLRLFNAALGGQAGWMVPFALFGLLAIVVWLLDGSAPATSAPASEPGWRPEADGPAPGPPPTEPTADAGPAPARERRRDRRLSGLLVLGGWFLVEATVLSFSKGIVHPYYLSALGPGTAAMVGAGCAAFLADGRHRGLRLTLLALGVAGAVAVQLTLLGYVDYLRWLWPVLVIGAAIGVAAVVLLSFDRGPARDQRAGRGVALALTLGLLLLAPAAYASTTWRFAVEGTFPAAGPRAAGAVGPRGADTRARALVRALLSYVDARRPGTRWALLTEASDTAAPMILLGHDAGAMGGYSGNDPALDGPGLARLIARGEARYVVLGGAYSERGGNAAANAVIEACRIIPAAHWQPRPFNPNALLLYDCAGRERQLRAH